MSEMDMYGVDEEEEEFYEAIRILLMAIQAVIYVLYDLVLSIPDESISRPLTRRPVTSNGYIYMNKILDGDPYIFREVYRMYPDVFRKLCVIIKEKTPLRNTRHICVEEMLATFLLVVGQNNRYSEPRMIFERSHFTVSRSFNKILKALNTIAPEFMAKPPPPDTTPPNIRESTRFYPFFKDCIEAIDGTHIPATVVGREVSRYRNRHGKISQNVLAACNFDLQFIYVLSGWEGSAHDSKVLNDAISRRNGLKVPAGKYYLGDCGFPNRRRFLAPFRGTRYHLKDFCGGEGNHPVNAVELFNLRHASLRNVIERIFGIFKSRFTIFKSAPPFPYKTQAELVLACAGLHNFLRQECRSDEFPPEPEDDPVENEEDNFQWDDFQTQEQQRDNANQWRMSIANQMWAEAQANANNVNNDNEESDHEGEE
ncbi:hypothetical protein ACLB2K_053025 [Fragaria x ananassa]